MNRFANLRLSTKLNLIMSFLLITLFTAAAFLTHQRQKSLIFKMAVDNARNYSRVIIESRDYMSTVVRDEPSRNYALVPQVVATGIARRMTEGSKYYVRQVSLRYRNPENRPDRYETAELERFRTRAAETYEVLTAPDGREVFRYLLPMRAEESCLECHGTYDSAPDFVKKRFPRGHFSYNYRLNEVIGAVSVSIPVDDLYNEIGANLEFDIIVRGAIFLLIIIIMATLIRKTIVNPITLLSETMSRVTKTGRFDQRLPGRGKDEIGLLLDSFNHMMEELQFRILQSRESEERYRNFIEMAHSAVITFLEDGKIIISNQRAEELFGLSRQSLLGENIFDFLMDSDEIRRGIAEYLEKGSGGGIGESRMRKVRSQQGEIVEVEMALAASLSDKRPLFTAILREADGGERSGGR